MRSCLMVLNPRRIPRCMTAIEALKIDKCWFSAMTEIGVVPRFSEVMEESDYDRYIIISDDATPTQAALDKVLSIHDKGHPVVTGYSNLDATSPFVNLSNKTLHAPPPTVGAYDLMLQSEVDIYGDDLIPTKFAGFSLTCMSRDLWLRFPYQVTDAGAQTDYALSWRLQEAGIPIVSHKDTFVYHVKEVWNVGDKAHEKRSMVGELEPSVYWTYANA